jgi:hypothetical protein
MITIEDLENIDTDKLNPEEILKLNTLLKELRLRKKNFPLLDFKTQSFQQELVDVISSFDKK